MHNTYTASLLNITNGYINQIRHSLSEHCLLCVIQPNTITKFMNQTSLKIKCLKDDDGTFHLHVGSTTTIGILYLFVCSYKRNMCTVYDA